VELICKIICTRCKREVESKLVFNEQLTLTDSLGFVAFDDGPVCDACLPYDPTEVVIHGHTG